MHARSSASRDRRSVTLLGIGQDGAAVDERQRGIHPEIRRAGVALSVKELERIHIALLDSETARVLIEIDLGRDRRVEPAQVDREPAIDEDPKIVVAREPERLAALVFELGMKLGGE